MLFALNPYVWQHKDRLLSETPFMLFAYLALLLAEKAQGVDASKTRCVIWGLFAGLTAYLAVGTRTVGVVLVPSILGCELLRRRRLGMASLSIAAAFLAGVAAEKSLLVLDGSYLDQLVFDPLRFVRIGFSLVKSMGFFVENGYSSAACAILYGCLLTLACVGYIARLREGPTVYELFAAFNCMLLVLWPAAEADPRFLMPILPLFFLYVGEGLCRLRATSMRRVEAPVAAGLTLAVLVSYAGWYTRLEVGPVRDGVSTPEAAALFHWIRERTEPEDVFLFQKPRALALYTQRRAGTSQGSRRGPAVATPALDGRQPRHRLRIVAGRELSKQPHRGGTIDRPSSQELRDGVRKPRLPHLSPPRGAAGFALRGMTPWRYSRYSSSSCRAYLSSTTLRRSFRLTVISSAATLNGCGTIRNFLTCSALDTSASAAATRHCNNVHHRLRGRASSMRSSRVGPVAGERGADVVPVRHDQGRQEIAALAADHRLIDARIGQQQPLEIARHHFLAVGQHQQLLLAAGDLEKAVGVELAQVAGVQPAVADGLGRRRRVVPVALHDVRPARQHLAVGGDLHLDAGQRPAHRVELVRVLAVERDDRRAFGQPVALQQQQAGFVIRLGDGQRQRRSAR